VWDYITSNELIIPRYITLHAYTANKTAPRIVTWKYIYLTKHT